MRCRPGAGSTRSRPVAASAVAAIGHVRRAATSPVIHSAIGAASGCSRSDTSTVGRPSPHRLGVPAHHLEVGPDQRGQVDLVDHQQVGAGDAGAALARHLVPAGHVQHEDLGVHQPVAEGGGQVVPAALDQHQVRVVPGDQLVDGVQVGGDVVADGGVRAAAGAHRADALVGQHAVPAQEVGVLGGVDVVGHHGQRQPVAQRPAQRRDQRGLAAADRTADADLERAPGRGGERRMEVRPEWVG